MKRTFLSFVVILSAIVAYAQESGNPGWQWEISGNGLTQKSYLFGTCHGDGLIAILRREGYTVEPVK